MKLFSFTIAIAVSLALSGCTQDVEVISAPDLSVHTSYADKVPGKWALYVDASTLIRDIHPIGAAKCNGYSYPINLSNSFRESVASTFRNVAEEVDLVDQAPSISALGPGYSGLIKVSSDDLQTHLFVFPTSYGFAASAEMNIEIDAAILVEDRSGKLLGTQASGSGRAEHDTGVFCADTATAITEATQQAMKAVIGELAERFADSPQVRANK